MINRRGFLASALALGLAVALPLAPRPVRRWIASARARWARRRLWGDLSDAEIRGMLVRAIRTNHPDHRPEYGALGSWVIEEPPGPDLGDGFRIADLPSLPGHHKAELEHSYQELWGRSRVETFVHYHEGLPLDDPRFGRRT